MNYQTIRYEDILNGPGFRTVVFVSGCDRHCIGCHNPETWDPNSGSPFTLKEKNSIIESLRDPYISGVTFSGGDPLFHTNVKEILNICKDIRKDPIAGTKTIWVYTGYKYEEIANIKNEEQRAAIFELFIYIDVLVDGEFMIEFKNPNCMFAGSTNQRLIYIPKTIKENKIVLWGGFFDERSLCNNG